MAIFDADKMKSTQLGLAAALVIAVGGVSFWAGTRTGADAPPTASGSPAKGTGAPAGIAVETRRVASAKLPQSITTVGSLRSEESVMVRPEIAGRVADIAFREGQRVARGDILVRLDDSIQKADLERANANLVLSRSKYERAIDLRAKGFISSQAKDEAENNLKVAEADSQLAAARLSKMTILAPFSGVIGLRSVSVGDFVKEGQDIVNLEAIDPLKVDFRVPELALSQVRAGQTLQINLDALPEKTYAGQVYAINPLIDANGRSIVIRAQVANVQGALRPGMFARVRLFTSESQDTLVVPEEALFPVGEDKYVYKVVDGRAQRQKIEIGQRRDGKVQVLAGLALNEEIVTAGVAKLRDGAALNIVSAPAGKAAEAAEKQKGS
jgi:membrane fusion protein (multidrug efflux system)